MGALTKPVVYHEYQADKVIQMKRGQTRLNGCNVECGDGVEKKEGRNSATLLLSNALTIAPSKHSKRTEMVYSANSMIGVTGPTQGQYINLGGLRGTRDSVRIRRFNSQTEGKHDLGF